MKTEFYRCPICGNIVLRVVNSGVTPVCCNQPMQKLTPNMVDASQEKHMPVITKLCRGTYRVAIGSEPHPVTDEHHIDFIYLKTEHGGQLRYLSPGHPAEVEFSDCYDPIVGVYAHCNLHGLWYADRQSCREGSCSRQNTGKIMAILAIVFPFFSCSCPAIDNKPVPIDLNRYLGKWYEIGRFNHWFERDMDNCFAEYSMDKNGHVRVVNTGWKGDEWKIREGVAKTTETSGLMRVSFCRPFYSDYRVLMIDEDYSLVLVGSKTAKYLWIMAREPEVSHERLAPLLTEARRRGYDPRQIIWVNQENNKMR